MITYIDNLLDGFDDASADMDPIALTALEASNVNINDIVQFQDVLGHGKRNYGIP
jgi:singapore isolate B (sub-type 7) whole genome shotgun sequence assembly, scaffold_15